MLCMSSSLLPSAEPGERTDARPLRFPELRSRTVPMACTRSMRSSRSSMEGIVAWSVSRCNVFVET